MNIKKIFGVLKIIIGITLMLTTIFSIIFELASNYYFNKAEYMVFYEELPNYIKFFMNFSVHLGAILTTLIAYYFYKSGILEIKNKKPIILIIRLLASLIPAILMTYLSLLVVYTLLLGATTQWTLWHKILFPTLVPLLAIIFIREIFLDKIR